VNDAEGVGIGQRGYHISQNSHGLRDGKFALAGDSGAQRFPVHERHNEIGEAFGFTSRKQWDDVRVLQLGGKLDLAPKPLHVHSGGQLRQEHLDYDFPAEATFQSKEHA
jgi:hypothetical protein